MMRSCSLCGLPMVPHHKEGASAFGRRRYCGAACQAVASRRRKPIPPGALDHEAALLAGIVHIPLVNTDAVALVDADVLGWAAANNWRLSPEGYAVASTGEKRGQYLHRLILGALPGQFVDHADAARTLDDRRKNLRFAEKVQNQQNQHRTRRHRVGFKGVWPVRAKTKSSWCANIRVHGKRMHLGCFGSPEDAARAYDSAALEHFGSFARLNFPDDPARSAIRQGGAG